MYQKYEQDLGLKWPVVYVPHSEQHTCMIVCQLGPKCHEVWLHSFVAQEPQKYLPDVVHELCHAWLAENVDPAFATVFFSKRCGALTENAKAQFERKAKMLYTAYVHIDIWVNELRHRYFPELTESSNVTFLSSIKKLAKFGEWNYLRTPEHAASLAMYLAESVRYPFEPANVSSILHGMGAEWKGLTLELAAFYETLPRLVYNRAQDLETFERSVQDANRIWQFPIEPRLVEEDDIAVWLV